ncbi:MAG: hypothetical protein RIC55_12800 [Pirellulaceae bacterium]
MSTTAQPTPNTQKISQSKNGRKNGRGRKPKGKSKTAADRNGSLVDDWPQWSAHLTKRKTPASMERIFRGSKRPPLLWSTPGVAPESAALIESLQRTALKGRLVGDLAEQLAPWLAEADGLPAPTEDAAREAEFALECLAWCYALPQLAQGVEQKLWWRLVDHLLDIAADAAGLSVEEQPLACQLLAGELPLALATLLPEVARCQSQASPAGKLLRRGVDALLDTGLPQARHLALHRPLLACWTRCALLADRRGAALFKGQTKEQLAGAVQQMLRLSRHNGEQALVEGEGGRWSKELFVAASRLFGGAKDQVRAALAVGLGRAPAKKSARFPGKPSDNSEWAELAVLRSSWDRRRDSVLATFHDRVMAAELNCGRSTLWSGPLETRIAVDGVVLEPADDWEEICWSADEDVDYLELEMKLAKGWKVQRQLVLTRQDRTLLAADALLGQRRGKIDYRLSLPLRDGVSFAPADESNEGYLGDTDHRALVLPLALPEWRRERGPGELSADGDRLTLSLQAEGTALYAPLLFDFKPSRFKSPFTWRRLTVAENLAIQPADVAVGYRVQIASRQWLLYRSLAAAAPRTLLGQHLASEFYYGRFRQDGEVDDLIEVENE